MTSQTIEATSETQECPYCAEPIKSKAVLCRYCKSDLSKPASALKTSNSVSANPPNLASELDELDYEYVYAMTLAQLYQRDKTYDTARQYYQQAVDICESKYGSMHENTAVALKSLASAERDVGHVAEARMLYEKSLTIFKTLLPTDDPMVLDTMIGLVSNLTSTSAFAEAEPLCKYLFPLYIKLHGIDGVETAPILQIYSAVLKGLGKGPEATMLSSHALNIWRAHGLV